MAKMNPPPDRKESFEARVLRQDGCWRWLASFNRKGYGVFIWGKGKRTGAHRAAWEYYVGPIPEKMWVLHRCDNPGCVNPGHLFLGDNDANVADKVAKGRQARLAGEDSPMWRNYKSAARGEAAGRSKLTEGQVREIRRRSRAGEAQNPLAAAFGVSQFTIWAVIHRLTWTHVSEAET